LAELSAEVGIGNAQAEHDLKGMRNRARQLTLTLKRVADKIWEKAVDGVLDTTIPENQLLYAKRGALQTELENTTLTIRLMQEATATAVEQQGSEYRRLESVQKMVSMHYNAIDNAAKLTAGSSEVKMINRFIGYCKGQVEPAHRRDVVAKLLALCMKDDTRKDNFLSTLAEQPEYSKEKGNLEWIRTQFLHIMRGSDWLGSQFSAMINIAFGHEKPQVYAARLMQACSVANIDIMENCKDNHIIRKLIQHWANGLPDSVQNQIITARVKAFRRR